MSLGLQRSEELASTCSFACSACLTQIISNLEPTLLLTLPNRGHGTRGVAAQSGLLPGGHYMSMARALKLGTEVGERDGTTNRETLPVKQQDGGALNGVSAVLGSLIADRDQGKL